MAVGGARSVPVMHGAQLASESQMTVTLSADQRVYDGEVASKFLDAFKRHMAAPFNLFQ
jgi:pyruvate dehydrogenase E2 component (dihydrolipoamide acetyltransferase)